MSFLSDSTVMVYLIRTVQIVCVLGSIILVHEFGHFIVAKKCGMTVDEFAVGIGPTLYRWERGGTLYRIGLFLFMGYVRIRGLEGGDPAPREQREPKPDEAPLEPQEPNAPPPADDPGSFYARPIPHRVAALLAGAGMNIVFAAFLFAASTESGACPCRRTRGLRKSRRGPRRRRPGSRRAGRLRRWDGQSMEGPGDVQTRRRRIRRPAVADEPGPRRPDQVRHGHAARAESQGRGRRRLIGVKFSDDSVSDIVERVDPGRPAAAAGIRGGDRIVAIAGEPVTDPASIRYALAEVPKDLELLQPEQVQLAPVQLTIERDGRRQDVVVHPEAKKRQRAKADEGAEGGSIEDYLVGDTGLALRISYQQLGWGAALRYGFADSWSILRDVFEASPCCSGASNSIRWAGR